MSIRPFLALGVAAAALAGCATTSPLPPTEVIRYHLGQPIARGTIAVEPMSGGAPASLEFKTYAAAVETELLKVGYTVPPQGVIDRKSTRLNSSHWITPRMPSSA